MKYIMFFALLLYSPSNYIHKASKLPQIKLISLKSNENYQKVISYLKLKEGFRATRYDDNGFEAIGYGQRIKFYPYSISDTISELEASKMLGISLKKHIEMVKKVYPGLNYNQTLAAAHISYTSGIGKMKRIKLIINNQLDSCVLFSLPYNEIRQFEYELFHK